MFILEKFNDTWNYTFIAVALIAIGIGTFITIRKIQKEEKETRKEKRAKEAAKNK